MASKGPKRLEHEQALPEELRPHYNRLVDEYQFAAHLKYGFNWVAYAVLADLVRAGWRCSAEATVDSSLNLTEKDRRTYYQDIVYFVCNILDSIDCKKPGTGIFCGTAGSPSKQVQERMAVLAAEIRALRGLVLPAETLVDLMDSVPVDPNLGNETDRVFPRWEFDDLRAALADAVVAGL